MSKRKRCNCPTESTAAPEKRQRISVDDKEPSHSENGPISKLPDEILIAIISLLSIREAVRTSVICNKWRYFWTLVTSLSIENDHGNAPQLFNQKRNRCMCDLFRISTRYNWMSKVLQLHQGSTLDRLRICSTFLGQECCRPHARTLIEFALHKGRRLERLEIGNPQEYGLFWKYAQHTQNFPQELFKTPFGVSSIKSLTHLTLNYINIDDQLVRHFLSHCLLLEYLCICGSTQLFALKVVGSSLQLKFLRIGDCRSLVKVEIFAPKLISFIYEGVAQYRIGIVLKHAPSLAKVSLAQDSDCISKPFASMTSCFSHLHTLKLCMRYVKQTKFMLPEFPELSSLKNLSLTISFANSAKVAANDGESLLALTSLIERSPFLRRLTLQLKWGYTNPVSTRNMHQINKCPHQCLKVVIISGFIGLGSVIDSELATYLIENAVVLDKLIVDLEKDKLRRSTILPEFVTTEKKLEATRKHALHLGTQLPPGAELVIT